MAAVPTCEPVLVTDQCGPSVRPYTAGAKPIIDRRLVLVTGSSGLVGSTIVAALKDRFRCRGLDVRAAPATTILGDLRDPSVRQEALAGVWGIVHVAALHAPQVGVADDANFWAINVEATRALVSEAGEMGVQRLIYTSSTSVYGRSLVPNEREAVWVDERLEPDPLDIYDETKLAAERIVTGSIIPAIVLRIARCFPEPPETLAAYRLYRGVDVQDVGMAHALALEHDHVVGTFNVAGPLVFQPADAPRLWTDARWIVRERLPAVAHAFDERGWRLPKRIDRVYDSRLAAQAIGYQPIRGVLDVAAAHPTQ